MKETLEVGDKIEISTFMSSMIVEIERVTKTKAVSLPYNSSGAVYEFKRDCRGDIRPYTRVRFSQTNYKLIN